LHELRVERGGELTAAVGEAGDDLRRGGESALPVVAGVDSLGRVGEREVDAGAKAGGLEDRPEELDRKSVV